MAKKQTRRSISLDALLYKDLRAFTRERGWSMAGYITDLVHQDFKRLGLVVPERPISAINPYPSTPGRKPVAPVIPVPAAALITDDADKATAEAAYQHALNHTRVALAKGLETGPRPANTCWWCHEKFHPEQTPIEYDEPNCGKVKLHAKCLRQINALPGGIQP